MLDAFIATARDRAVPARVVLGEWPRRGRGGGIRRRGGRGALTRPRVAATLTWSGGE